MSKIKVQYSNVREFVRSYLGLFAFEAELTNKEFITLIEIVLYYIQLKDQVKEPYLTELVLSTDRRKEIQANLDIAESSFNNILNSLKSKGIFGEDKSALNRILFPQAHISFEFVNVQNTQEREEVKEVPEQIDSFPALPDEAEEIPDVEKIETSGVFDGSEFDSSKIMKVVIKDK